MNSKASLKVWKKHLQTIPHKRKKLQNLELSSFAAKSGKRYIEWLKVFKVKQKKFLYFEYI